MFYTVLVIFPFSKQTPYLCIIWDVTGGPGAGGGGGGGGGGGAGGCLVWGRFYVFNQLFNFFFLFFS